MSLPGHPLCSVCTRQSSQPHPHLGQQNPFLLLVHLPSWLTRSFGVIFAPPALIVPSFFTKVYLFISEISQIFSAPHFVSLVAGVVDIVVDSPAFIHSTCCVRALTGLPSRYGRPKPGVAGTPTHRPSPGQSPPIAITTNRLFPEMPQINHELKTCGCYAKEQLQVGSQDPPLPPDSCPSALPVWKYPSCHVFITSPPTTHSINPQD